VVIPKYEVSRRNYVFTSLDLDYGLPSIFVRAGRSTLEKDKREAILSHARSTRTNFGKE